MMDEFASGGPVLQVFGRFEVQFLFDQWSGTRCCLIFEFLIHVQNLIYVDEIIPTESLQYVGMIKEKHCDRRIPS